MNKVIHIEYLDCYVPETQLNLADCPDLETAIDGYFSGREDFLRFSTNVLSLDGIRVERQLDLEGMAMSVLDKYMHRQGVDTRTVKFIIIATDQSDALKDFGHKILGRFALPRTTVFRISDNYCANIDLAIGLAATLLRAEKEPGKVIILSGTRRGEGLTGRVVGAYGIVGDSAGITVLSSEEGPHLAEVGGQVVITRGELAEMDLTKDNTPLHLQ